eukprot:5909280-Alexandrium_andersonii.AAC.1
MRSSSPRWVSSLKKVPMSSTSPPFWPPRALQGKRSGSPSSAAPTGGTMRKGRMPAMSGSWKWAGVP